MTLQTVADRCGVSAITVSRTLRGHDRVAPETAARVRAVALELGYDPGRNRMARQMVFRRHGLTVLNETIAVLFPPLFYEAEAAVYFGPIYHGVMTVAMLGGFSILNSYAGLPFSEEQLHPVTDIDRLPSAFARGEVDGAIFTCNPWSQEALAARMQAEPGFARRPIVTLIHPTPGCSSVTTDDYVGARAAGEHLLALGHRHFLHFLDAGDERVYGLRLAGLSDALAARGLDPRTGLHLAPWDKAQETVSAADAAALVRARPELTAVVARNDPGALLLETALRAIGLRVPEDISLIGHDGTMAQPDRFGPGGLSTIRLPLTELGRVAARLLLEQVGKVESELVDLVLPVEFVPGASSGPARPRRA